MKYNKELPMSCQEV